MNVFLFAKLLLTHFLHLDWASVRKKITNRQVLKTYRLVKQFNQPLMVLPKASNNCG
jgi:hypothetical protein